VDEINTRPFNTPRYVEGEILALIHQLAMEFWIYETPFPLSLIGPFLERLWLRPYRMIPTVTVSRSTKDDLARLGFREVYIVHNGLNVKPLSRLPEKRAEPTIIYVGRMKRAKRPQDVIDAFRVVRKEVPDARLWMVGEGYLREKLQQEAGEGVVFYGYVERDHLRCLLTQAWVIAVPGVREGWGQVVTDANALGTPAVGYDIPGLRDSIVHGHTGILTSSTVHALAEALIRILTDHGLRRRLSLNALEWARKFDWDRSAQRFEEVVQLVTSR
jgi:glycosyltransferase involved in cell wall biosynthesis